jgi:acetate---CoA ligase (ADP-forming) subunit beta
MSNISKIIEHVRGEGRPILTEMEAKQVCREANIPVVETLPASSQREAIAGAEKIGFPLVLKIASPDITHKTDAGGVKIGLKNKTELMHAYREIMASAREKFPEAKIDGVTVQAMARPGTETIVGMFKDPQFGAVLMFGLGGIFVEVLKDVSFRIIPILHRDAAEMISEIKGYALLQGYRGHEPAHLPSLVDILLKVSDLAEKNPGIKEIDLNPIFAYKDSALAVDARIILDS